MKRFRFRFETVLTLRKEEEEVQKKELSRLVSHWNGLKEEENRNLKEISNIHFEMNHSTKKGGTLQNYMAMERFVEILKIKNVGLLEKMKESEKEISNQRERLAQAVKDRMTMEVLRDSDYKLWKRKIKKAEKKEMEYYNASLSSQFLEMEIPKTKVPKVFHVVSKEASEDSYETLKDFVKKYYGNKGLT